MKKSGLRNLVPLEYVQFMNVPMRQTKHGLIVDVEPHTLEVLAAKAVILERIPLRGLEVNFLRKTMGFSFEKFAGKMGLSASTVLHWEKALEKRLDPVNEAAVRALMAELLKVPISGKFSELLGDRLHEIHVQAV